MQNCQFDRRRFFGATCSAAAASLICGTSPAQDVTSRPRIRKAVKFQMVSDDLTVLDKFKLLKELGFDGTEVTVDEVIDQRQVAEAIQQTGLPVHGVINGFDPRLRAAIDLANFLGGDSVLVVAQEDMQRSYEQNFQHWQQLIRPLVPYAEKNAVRLMIENVHATFLKTAEEMARFIDSFDSPFVAAYFDTGNAITWTHQSAQHWASVLGQRIGKLDIKDRGHAEFGDAELRSEEAIGTDGGEVHWQQVREQLARLNFTGWATAEVTGGDRHRLAGIAAWMDNVLGQ